MRFYEIYILRILTLFLLVKCRILRFDPGNAFVSVIYIYIFSVINQSINKSINQLIFVILAE